MKKENILEIFKNLAVRAQKAGILNLEEVPIILQAIELQESQAEIHMTKELQVTDLSQTKKENVGK